MKKTGVTVTAKYGMKRIERLAQLRGVKAVKVGVLRGTGTRPNAKEGITIALIAWWNEFGNKRIPERPFLRTTLHEHGYYREHLKRAMTASLIKTAKFKTDLDSSLKAVGVIAASDIRKKIVDGPWQPNAPETKRKKSTSSGKKARPLIDTGIMRKSIQSALSDEHA